MTTGGAKSLYLQVIAGVLLGIFLGVVWPTIAVEMQPFGDAFIKLVRMIIAPIVFVTVAVGIAKLSDAAEVGRIGLKAIILNPAVGLACEVESPAPFWHEPISSGFSCSPAG